MIEKDVLDQIDDLADEWKINRDRRDDIDMDARQLLRASLPLVSYNRAWDYYCAIKKS